MDKITLFHNLVQMAAADGKFTDEEIRFLVLRAEAWGIPSEEFDTAMAGLTTGEAELLLPTDRNEQLLMMKELIEMMAADGELAEQEKRLCAAAAAAMNLSKCDIDAIIENLTAE